jgi:hypothetical protein
VRNTRNSRNGSDDTIALWQRPLIWAGNCLLTRPRDSLLSIGAATAAGAIVINGLYLQPGPHPAPIFAFKPMPVTADAATGAVVAMPRARPEEAASAQASAVEARFPATAQPVSQPQAAAPSAATARPAPPPRRDPIADLLASPPPKRAAAGNNLVASREPAAPVPPASIPAASSSAQLRTIQQRLGEFGYGPVKATGLDGPETRVAIERFERSHSMPVTGKVSERLKTELVNMTGPL